MHQQVGMVSNDQTDNCPGRSIVLLLTDGWIDESRFYGMLIHIQVKEDGHVWLHEDNTDLIVVDWLQEQGIPKKDIVPGWHTPSME